MEKLMTLAQAGRSRISSMSLASSSAAGTAGLLDFFKGFFRMKNTQQYGGGEPL